MHLKSYKVIGGKPKSSGQKFSIDATTYNEFELVIAWHMAHLWLWEMKQIKKIIIQLFYLPALLVRGIAWEPCDAAPSLPASPQPGQPSPH